MIVDFNFLTVLRFCSCLRKSIFVVSEPFLLRKKSPVWESAVIKPFLRNFGGPPVSSVSVSVVSTSLCVCFLGFFFGLVLLPFLFWTALLASWGGVRLSTCDVPAKSTALWRFLTPLDMAP